MHKYGWSSAFPTWAESWDLTNGRIPMISWSGGSVASINSGSEDALIRARADGVKALGSKVFVRLLPQMDLTGSTPTAFISAWQRVRRLFNEQGATNAVWAWCPSAAGFQSGTAQTYYPGDTSVDWICAEGYNWAPGGSSTWKSFFNIFKPFYDWARAKPKPLMIGGTGAQERAAGEKASWIGAMGYSIETSFPNVQALVYTDAEQTYDWRADTSPGAYAKYKEVASDPYFNPTSTTATTTGTLLGAYVQPSTGWLISDYQSAVTSLETRMGRKLDVDHHYYAWTESFPGPMITWDIENGRIPMASWDGPVVTSINSGSEDPWIRQQADAIKSVAKPVMIRWMWEMDIRTDKSVGPTEFISAWRRLYTIFENRGVTNVRWVWCPTAYGFATGKAQTFYPGDAYVDWICSDGYNWGDATNGKWRSFEDIFAEFYKWSAPRAKPLMIGETGSQEGLIGQKAQWITDAGAAIKNVYPKVKALVYFDSKTSSYSGGMFDWQLDSTTGSLDAWKKLGADPYFAPSHSI